MSDRMRTLRSRLLAWSFIPAVFALAVVAVVIFLAYQKATQDVVLAQDRELAYLSASRLREELTKYSDILDDLTRNQNLLTGSRSSRQGVLNNAARRLTVFDSGVVFLDPDGRVVASIPDETRFVGFDWSDRPYFSELAGSNDIHFSDTTQNGLNNDEVVAVSVPVLNSNNEFLGVLVGMFKLGETDTSSFYASIVRLRIGKAGSSFVVDSTGRVIYHSNPDEVGKDYSDHVEVRQVLRGNNDVIRLTTPEGKVVAASYAPVPGTPWGLVTTQDWAQLSSSNRAIGQVLIALLALGMVLPALGVAQVARQRYQERVARDRIERELQFAKQIQQTLLPKEAPQHPDWQMVTYYKPAQAVGGDFYDFIQLENDRLGVVIGDVSDKGVPAALVMATTRTLIRLFAQQNLPPGTVLRRVNDELAEEIPRNMFVTCLYAVLDLNNGHIHYANAGHNAPMHSSKEQVSELWATGMPLGLMPDMFYEEMDGVITQGDRVLLYSDGLTEAHDAHREMFGEQRLGELLEHNGCGGPDLIHLLLEALKKFTGKDWVQEDDVTLVVLKRCDEMTDIKGDLE